MTTEIPDSVLEAITAVVYWADSSDDDNDILSYDIPLLKNWIVKLGVSPPPPMDPIITDEAAKAGREAARRSRCD